MYRLIALEGGGGGGIQEVYGSIEAARSKGQGRSFRFYKIWDISGPEMVIVEDMFCDWHGTWKPTEKDTRCTRCLGSGIDPSVPRVLSEAIKAEK